MLSNQMQQALNDQINAELYSSYLYYSMAAYFEAIALTGFAHWMRIQALEELTHVRRIEGYINDRGGRVTLDTIQAPQTEWEKPLDAFESTYEHEVMVTGKVNKLVDLARDASDHSTYNFLQWFVSEQVEEEANTQDILQKLKLVETDRSGLFMLDRELAARAFNPPPDFKL